MLAPVRIVTPAITPVSLAEAKAHLRVEHEEDDALIAGFIAAATDYLDGWTGILGRCLVEQTWKQDFEVAREVLGIPLAPVISIFSVTYPDANGDPVTIDSADYALKVDAGGRGGVLLRANAVPSGPISVTYVAGYKTVAEVQEESGPPSVPAVPARSTVPPAIKVAILLLVGNYYENREATTTADLRTLPFAVDALIAPFRRVGV